MGSSRSWSSGLTQVIKYPGLTRILHWIMCRDQLIMCLLLPIMLRCSALKIHLSCSIVCSRTRIVVRLLCFYMQHTWAIHYMKQTILKRLFYKSVLLKYIMSYHTLTVLLEYMIIHYNFPQMLDITINIYFIFPYYAGIMLNAFNDLLSSKLCQHNRRVLNHMH